MEGTPVVADKFDRHPTVFARGNLKAQLRASRSPPLRILHFAGVDAPEIGIAPVERIPVAPVAAFCDDATVENIRRLGSRCFKLGWGRPCLARAKEVGARVRDARRIGDLSIFLRCGVNDVCKGEERLGCVE